MIFVLSVLILVYFITIFPLATKGSRNACRRIKFNNEIDTNVIYLTKFSSKPENNLVSYMIISLIFAGCLIVIEKGNMDMSETMYMVVNFSCWTGFALFAIFSIFFGWLSIVTRGENLIVSDNNIIGTVAQIKGLKIELSDIDVNIADIKEIIIVKQEKVLGIEMTAIEILTIDNKYEFVMPVDAEGIKTVIEKRMAA